MKRPGVGHYFALVIWLVVSVIWHSPVAAATEPVFESLGQIRDQEVMATPGRIDVDAEGSIYVTDARSQAVVKFDKHGDLARIYAGEGSGVPVSGSGIAVTPAGDRIYVAGENVVTVLDGATGDVLARLGSGDGEFAFTGEIDLDAAGFVFVADSGEKKVKVYTDDAVPLRYDLKYEFGGFGTGAGEFRTIWAMSVDERAGEVYVADNQQYKYSYPKIQIFGLDGTLKQDRLLYSMYSFGDNLSFYGGFAFDDAGRGYFPDTFKGDIRVLELPQGVQDPPIYVFSQVGFEVGQLKGPLDSIYDPLTGRLFVVCDGGRIEVFGIDGGKNPEAANVAPGLPLLQSPVADGEVTVSMPDLVLVNAEDADSGDSLTYDVEVLAGDDIISLAGLPEGEGVTTVSVGQDLLENARYQWRVQASDGKLASGWTATESFYVNAVDEAPSVPVAVAPLAGEEIAGDGELAWQASVDPDPFDQVGYVVEVAADAAFAEVIASAPVSGLSVRLGDLDGYDALADGVNYYWRVKAVDEHAVSSAPSVAGIFRYDTTLLEVTCNMPGASVYLGGNLGYAGRLVGTAPLKLRDFTPGVTSVVVERAGFEPFVAQVRVAERENATVAADLVPVVVPADLKARPLQAAGADILLGGDATPYVVDFDSDGQPDLLAAEASGSVTLFRGTLSDAGDLAFTSGVALDLPLIPGAAPFVVDWDNDGRKDLLLGAEDGTVSLFVNLGSEDAPAYGTRELVEASGESVAVGAASVPAVIDLDGDGDKDLVVGSAAGSVRLFDNIGSDVAPSLASAGVLVSLPSAVAPHFVDWDGDGVRDLMLAASEHLYRYGRQANGSYVAREVLSVSDSLVGGDGKSSSGSSALGDRLRVFAFDYDGRKGKDLLLGNAAGEVRLVSSHGDELAASVFIALIDKVDQIAGLAGENAEALALLDELSAALDAADLKAIRATLKDLAALAPAGTEFAQELTVMQGLLG